MPFCLPTRAARTLTAATLAVCVTPALSACASTPTTAPATTATTYDATTTATPGALETDGAGAGLEVLDAWTKAVPDVSGMAMTAVFGVVRNTSSNDVVLSSVSTSASARAELHTTVTEGGSPVMKAVDKLTIPVGGSLLLQPGGDHVMVLDLTTPIAVGDTVSVTLTTQDGKKLEFPAVAKQFTGAKEPYHSSGSTMTGGPASSAS